MPNRDRLTLRCPRSIGQTCENHRRRIERERKRADHEYVRLRPRSFGGRRHLKLVRPSLRLTTSRGAYCEPRHSNCHDVTFLDPPLTSVSYACVRACMSRCFKPDLFRCLNERTKKFSLEAKKNDPNEFN